MRIVLWSLLSFFLSPPAQDPVAVNPKIASVEFEHSRVRIVRMHFAPHERLALHYHPAQLVVRLTPSVLEVHDLGGALREVQGPAESIFWGEPTTHTVDNAGDAPIETIEIEFKNASAPSAPVPAPPLRQPDTLRMTSFPSSRSRTTSGSSRISTCWSPK